jgi:hypothetical protein
MFDVMFGFYVIMGGFIATPSPHPTQDKESDAPLTLSSGSVLNLAQHGYFLEMKKSAIDDKIKSSGCSLRA